MSYQYYQGPPVDEITVDRALFLYHLRVNPHDVEQTTGTMFDIASQARCALGLGCQAFDIPVAGYEALNQAYTKVAQRLQLTMDEIEAIWKLNDRYHLSFAQIADRAEAHFKDHRVPIITPADYKRA